MTFLELVEYLARRLGHHQVPVNPDARVLKDLIESGAVHYAILKQVLSAIYARNQCRRLNDPVRLNEAFDALAPVRTEILESARTDVDQYHFMENLCMAIGEALGVPPGNAIPSDALRVTRPKAAVIPLDRFRARRQHESQRHR
jgi:hypothetical protein